MAKSTNSPHKNKGKITLKIECGKRSERYSSATTEIGGFKWHLQMRKLPIDPFSWEVLSFCVSDNDTKTATVEKLWLCKAQVTIRSKLSFCKTWNSMSDQFHFFNGHTCQKWADTLTLGPDLVEIEMEVKMKNYNLSMPLESDLQMLYNGREELVAVNKFALASFSSYFRNLFFGDWSERAGNDEKKQFHIIEESDFDLNVFKLMLYSTMAMGNLVEGGNFLEVQMAVTVLKLSVKYDLPMLRDYCQEYLMKPSTKCAKMEMLEVAEQLGLLKLKDYCLAKIDPLDMTRDFGHNAEIYARLSKQTHQQRLDEELSVGAGEIAEYLHDTTAYGKEPRNAEMEE